MAVWYWVTARSPHTTQGTSEDGEAQSGPHEAQHLAQGFVALQGKRTRNELEKVLSGRAEVTSGTEHKGGEVSMLNSPDAVVVPAALPD